MANVLITHGGTHSADEWALAIARMIFDIDAVGAGRMLPATETQSKIARAVLPHVEALLNAEKNKLSMNPNHCNLPYDVAEHVHNAIAAVHEVGKGTPWEALLNGAEWSVNAGLELEHQFRSALHVERLFHADQNPHNQIAANYKAAFHPKA